MAGNEYRVKLTADPSGFVAGTRQAKGALGDLSGQLASLRSLSGKVLAFGGASLAVREFISIADAAGQTTARLRLATKATGDYEEVQRALAQGAREARAPLADSVSLFAQIAPSLDRVGISSLRTAAAVKTVNQAIALSGSAGPSAAAALQQLSQGLAANELRGAELNSILEQTPGLATALAEGLGVPVGALKQLAMNGEITAEAFVKSMEKVAKRVDEDFRAMPTSVSQSMTILNDAISGAIASFDQQSGLTAEIGSSIIAVADGITALQPAVNGVLVPLTNIVINFVDVVGRFFKTIGIGLAGYAVAIQQVARGDLQAAKETVDQIGADVSDVWAEGLRSQKALQAQQKKGSDERIRMQEDLVREQQRLEDLRKVATGQANADILKSDKDLTSARMKLAEEALKARLKGEETLRDNLRKAAEDSLKDAQKAREEAEKLRGQGRDRATSLQDRAAERRARGLSEEERGALAERQASRLGSEATLAAGAAQTALRAGDLKRAQRLAEGAVKLAERAEKAADAIVDDDVAARALTELSRLQEKIAGAQAGIKDAEAAQLEQQAAQQFDQIAKAEERIKALQAVLAAPISIALDISEAEAKIQQLQERLNKLNGVQASVPASFATGGYTGPGGKYQPAGVVHAREFVVRSEVTAQSGVRAFLENLNRNGAVAMRGYAEGGFVTPRAIRMPSLPDVRPAAGAGGPSSVVVLDLGRAGRFETRADAQVAEDLTRVLRRESLKGGAR